MLILYALLVFALSSSIVADSDVSDSDAASGSAAEKAADAAEKAADAAKKVADAGPKALEYSKHPHLIHHTWFRFKPQVPEAERCASWSEDKDLDDVLIFIPDGSNGIVNVTYLIYKRVLKGTTLGAASERFEEISPNMQLTDLNKNKMLFPKLEGYWGRSDLAPMQKPKWLNDVIHITYILVKDNIFTADEEQPIKREQWAVKFLKIRNKKMKETFLKAPQKYELSDEEAEKEQERIRQEKQRRREENKRLKGEERAKGGSGQPSTGAGGSQQSLSQQNVEKKRKGQDVASDPKRSKG